MIAEPVKENDYYDADRTFMDSKQYVGDKTFRFTSTSKERVIVRIGYYILTIIIGITIKECNT
jgi:hypothetical protein